MTALPDLEPCAQCDHKRGEHASTAGGSFNVHPVHYGRCRVTGCDCGEYQPKPTSDQSESARYRTIVADPPWAYDGGDALPFASGLKLNGEQQQSVGPRDSYERMTLEQIVAVRPPAANDAHLYLWTTNAFMCEAHEIARAWGFAPKTILTWTKTHQGNRARVSMKTGYYFRGATEHCLFCVRGSLKLQTREGLPTGYFWPRLSHSVKPDAFYDLVETASPGPYLEVFARRARFGWDYWGNESLQTTELMRTASDGGHDA